MIFLPKCAPDFKEVICYALLGGETKVLKVKKDKFFGVIVAKKREIGHMFAYGFKSHKTCSPQNFKRCRLRPRVFDN